MKQANIMFSFYILGPKAAGQIRKTFNSTLEAWYVTISHNQQHSAQLFVNKLSTHFMHFS